MTCFLNGPEGLLLPSMQLTPSSLLHSSKPLLRLFKATPPQSARYLDISLCIKYSAHRSEVQTYLSFHFQKGSQAKVTNPSFFIPLIPKLMLDMLINCIFRTEYLLNFLFFSPNIDTFV